MHDHWTVNLDHPIRPASRWGHGRPPHPELSALIDAGRNDYAKVLTGHRAYADAFATIGRDYVSEDVPYWRCGWLSPLDLVTLYSMVVSHRPRTYLEVGSGCSTAFVRHAVKTFGLDTRIVSIDPEPRAGIDAICDTVIRSPLEATDLSVFDELTAGDVFFFDGSHRCFPNSDVTVAFLEVLPRLAGGVIVGIDDIYLPHDYPPEWNDRFYSEQYVLAAWLLGGSRRLSLLSPNYFVSQDPVLSSLLESLWSTPVFAGLGRGGNSFWMTTT